MERLHEHQPHAGANAAVGHVKRGEPERDVKLEKIHHVMMHHAIHKIADHAAEDQPKRELAKRRLRPEMTP